MIDRRTLGLLIAYFFSIFGAYVYIHDTLRNSKNKDINRIHCI
jgi:hypothetical protein